MNATIEIDGLRKRSGPAQALDEMTFTVRPGQVTGFVGPNGAGKSTTMRVVVGLDAPGDTQEGEHRAGSQERGPPAGLRGDGEPHHRSGAGRYIRAGACGRVTDVREHPGPVLRAGSHQGLPGNVLVPCLQDIRLTMTGPDQIPAAPCWLPGCAGMCPVPVRGPARFGRLGCELARLRGGSSA
jgi:ABC-type dipeptide/oligopeptide/nickel transport system ATPase component